MIKPIWAIAGFAALGAASAAAIYVAGTGGEEEIVQSQATATSTFTEASPSTTPTGTSPSATPAETATPAGTPLPGGKAPDGCTPGEKAYVDPDGRFAFCYLDDMHLTSDETSEGVGVLARRPEDSSDATAPGGVLVQLYWSAQHHEVTGDPCIESLSGEKNRRVADSTIAGIVVPTCFSDHSDPQQEDVLSYKRLSADVPVPSGGFLIVIVSYSATDPEGAEQPVDQIVLRILESISVAPGAS